MLDVTKTLISEFQKILIDHYRALFGDQDPDYLAMVKNATDQALSSIAKCNASYHNVEHTFYVTAAGLAILEGKNMETPLTTKQWTEAVLAMLFHDIGFVRGLCKNDTDDQLDSGTTKHESIRLHRGDTDASMMPYHVDRGQCFVDENYQQYENIDLDLIKTCIERTRFPIPDTPEHQKSDDMPGLVRAADLIGQFSDPRYIKKLNALFQEFEEQGTNKRIGYHNLQDMCEGYPEFFENQIEPFIQEGVRLLEKTDTGKEIVASMYKNLQTARECLKALP